MFVAQQMFKEQIERYSSASYRIRGTVEEPEVELLAVLDDQPSGEDAQAAPDESASGAAEPASGAGDPEENDG